MLSDFIEVTITPNEDQLSLALNRFFDKFSSDHVALPEEFLLPLAWLDSSDFSEKMPFYGKNGDPIVYLHEDQASLGTWRVGTIIEISGNMCKIQASAESVTVHQSLVYSSQNDFSDICERLMDAVTRRHKAVALLMYHHVIASVPCDASIVSIMQNSQIDMIKAKACTLPLEQCSPIILGEELEGIQFEFKMVMNRVVLNAVLRSSRHVPLFVPLDFTKELPWLFMTSKKAPKLGCIRLPAHDMKSVKQTFEKSSFLCSSAALKALEGTVSENYHIQQLTVLPTTYKHSHTLQSFERLLGDTLTSAIRAIKQEWPQRTASAIRKALMSDPKKRYDLNIRNAHEFEV